MLDRLTNAKLSNQYATKWTPTARDCYFLGCNCKKYHLAAMLEERCMMRDTVFELVRKFGAPPKNDNDFSVKQQQIIDAILSGANNRLEIAKAMRLEETAVQSYLPDLYKFAEYNGFVFPNKRNKLGHFIKWVRGNYEAD